MIETLEKTFSFAAFEVDAVKRRLTKNGQPIALNPKAFDLLLTLIENRGQILLKEELLEKVWANQFVEENNLTVHISALRKIFGEKKNENRFIVTVPGKGYKFVAEVQSINDQTNEPAGADVKPQNEIPRPEIVSEEKPFVAPKVKGENLSPAVPAGFNEGETLVGREREIGEIKNLLRGDAVNLISLTGTGGTGKTSLARAIAEDSATDFPDGVFFVELAAITEAELFIPAIAQALDVKESGGATLFDNLINFLLTRRILLVLDNFEQLISAAPILKEISAPASRLKILVTSRTALRIKNEREFAVMPLAVPPRESAASIDKLTEYASVTLFAKRAQSAKPGFVLDGKNVSVVTEICQKLDGLPLAIELAAARLKLLSPQAILDRLENSLNLLTGGAKDLTSRQRTMRGAIEWSYELLDDDEKVTFRRLAVFAGGFSVEAAEAVVSHSRFYAPNADESEFSGVSENTDSKSDFDVLNHITALIDNNLLTQIEQSDGGTRLRMLEVVREFAFEQLQTNAKLEISREIHALYFLELAEFAEPHLNGEKSTEWLAKLETEIDNLRAALYWALKNKSETAVRITAAARFFWINRSQLTEGIEWFTAALEKAEQSAASLRYKLLSGLGSLNRLKGDYAAAAECYGLALAEGKANGDRRQTALASSGLGTILYLKGDLAAAKEFYEEGLKISRDLKDDFGVAAALNCLGVLAVENGEKKAARRFLEEALAIYQRLGNKEAVGTALNLLGTIAVEENRRAEAQAYFTEGLSLAEELGNKINIADSLNGFAVLAVKCRQPEQAARLAGAAEKLHASIGYNREPFEQLFYDTYLNRARELLDEKTFAAAFEQGQTQSLNEVVAFARSQALENGASGNNTDENFPDFDEHSEIIIENHSFSRVIIEEEIGEDNYKTVETKTSKLKNAGKIVGVQPKIIYLSIAAILLTGLLTFWFWNNGGSVRGTNFNLSKLTTSGKITNAALTPDGKYTVFSQTENDGESLWLRHIATGSQKQILPVKAVKFVGLAASPDGNTIYATIFSPQLPDPQIWRVPVLGGSTEEIKGITTGAAVSFSPAGDKIAFIESRSQINENHLLVADADGTNKKILARAVGDSRSFSNFNANPVAWSPDGSEIACAFDEKNAEGARKAGILLFNTADGSEKQISEKRWDYIEHLAWIDAENLAFVAYTSELRQGQIWTISKNTGVARQITNDLNSYSWLASAAGNLLTVQKNSVSYISTGDFDEKNDEIEPREIFKESGSIDYLAAARNGAILYSSSANGKREIWRANSDGSNPAQLTVNANIAFGMSVSPVDGSIVFGASENGKYFLKITDADGKNMRPLTEGAEDVYPNFTADGQTIVFQRGFKDKLITLWRVSLADKTPVQITGTHATHPAVSPDGAQTAHYFMDAETDNLWRIRLISTADGSLLHKLSFPKAVTERRMRWHPSGKYIGQIFYEGENIKLLLLQVDGGEARIISNFGKGNVNWFEWSRDGQHIIFAHTTETQDVVFLSQ